MKRWGLIVMVAVALLAPLAAQSLEAELQRAIQRETATGDVKNAIAEYQSILQRATRPPRDRAVAAKALLRIAEAHEVRGQLEARRWYEQLIKEYSDLPQAAIARAALESTGVSPSRAQTSRLLWTAPRDVDVYGHVSRSGRFVPYVKWQSSVLFLRDLSTGADRQLTQPSKTEGTAVAVISPDETAIGYSWVTGKNSWEVRVLSLDGTGPTEPRTLFRTEEGPVSPYDWSSDRRFIAAIIERRADRTVQFGLLSVADGSWRPLKTTAWRGAANQFLSPDGRYLAFDLRPAGGNRDIHVIAADGSRESTVVRFPSDDVLAGWTPRGDGLVFKSNRTGSWALWNVPVTDGRATGEARLVVRDAGTGYSLGISDSGSLYSFQLMTSGSDIKIGEFDFAKRTFVTEPVHLAPDAVGTFHGEQGWSREGRYFAAESVRPSAGGNGISTIRVLNIDSMERREIDFRVGQAQNLHWSPDGGSLVAEGGDPDGRRGIFQVDVRTGDMKPIAIAPARSRIRMVNTKWSSDGSKIYFRRDAATENEGSLVEHDVSSGTERTLFDEWARSIHLSADGRYLTFVRLLPAGKRPPDAAVVTVRDLLTGTDRELTRRAQFGALAWSSDGRFATSMSGQTSGTQVDTIVVVPTTGGESREIFKAPAGQAARVLAWTPANDALLVRTAMSAPTPTPPGEIWWVPVASGQPERLVFKAGENVTAIHVSPDGRRLAYTTSQPETPQELWVLENFLEPVATKR